ncbi:GNAT family N-acetyltransferase [Mesobacillus zeae]|uniref:N-acetyltransferase n=1 Tax=Mesobacillus zeae TaxID=1917180 RepID=A0A398B4B0_9BACI|nr:GNAT family protein [Mesobacillus zeae]RID82606.1 N-acetyltransferase [Mesobacillus zeae]
MKEKKLYSETIREDDLEEILNLTNKFSERGEHWHLMLSSEPMFKKGFRETGFWDDKIGKLLITDKNGRLFGEISYFNGVWYMPGYEIGYQLYRKEDQGKGYMTEALTIFAAYLFELKPIERLELTLNIGNAASRKVAEKCGFKFEGIKRNAIYLRGLYHDIELFSLLRHECPTLSEVLVNIKK